MKQVCVDNLRQTLESQKNTKNIDKNLNLSQDILNQNEFINKQWSLRLCLPILTYSNLQNIDRVYLKVSSLLSNIYNILPNQCLARPSNSRAQKLVNWWKRKQKKIHHHFKRFYFFVFRNMRNILKLVFFFLGRATTKFVWNKNE